MLEIERNELFKLFIMEIEWIDRNDPDKNAFVEIAELSLERAKIKHEIFKKKYDKPFDRS